MKTVAIKLPLASTAMVDAGIPVIKFITCSGGNMGKVLLSWTYECDMIECPDYISSNIIEYVNRFDSYLYDKNNQHGHWTKDSFGNDAVCFGSEDFVRWLNKNVIQPKDRKVSFIKRSFQADEEEKHLPCIYF